MKRMNTTLLTLAGIMLVAGAVQAAPQKTQPTTRATKHAVTAKKAPKLQGKLGDILSDGKWQFQVLSLDVLDSFHLKNKADIPTTISNVAEWNSADRVLTARSGYRIIVLVCRVTNNEKTTKRLWTSPTDEKMRTALVDATGLTYRPIALDYPSAPTQTPPFAPGAVQIFPIIFGVKQESKPKELVFTLKHNDYFAKGTDVRVALTWAKNTTNAQQHPASTQKIPITPAPMESAAEENAKVSRVDDASH